MEEVIIESEKIVDALFNNEFNDQEEAHFSEEGADDEEEEIPCVKHFCGNKTCACEYTKSRKDDQALVDTTLIDQNGIFVSGLPRELDHTRVWEGLGSLLKGIYIKHTNVPEPKDENKKGLGGNIGSAFMEFTSHKDAVKALKILKEKELFGCPLKVNFRANLYKKKPFIKNNK